MEDSIILQIVKRPKRWLFNKYAILDTEKCFWKKKTQIL